MGGIVTLKGPDRVRRRPAVIFGSADIDGVMTAFEMVLNTLMQDGRSSQVTVTKYRDDSLEIRDDGRGIYLGDPNNPSDKTWKLLFCELYAGSAYLWTQQSIFEAPENVDDEPTDSLELCAVQYASEYMTVRVTRDGFLQALRFEKGYAVGDISRTADNGPTGTCIRFKPDRQVFSEISLPVQRLAERLQSVAISLPGVKVQLHCETEEGFEKTEFCYPEGIADYLQLQNEGAEATPVYTAQLEAEGQERYNKPRYTAKVRIGLRFVKDNGFETYYHNIRQMTHGGTHRDGILEKVEDYLRWMLGCEIDRFQLLRHLQLVVVTESEISEWTNGARTGIQNLLIRDMARDTIGEEFRQFVKENGAFLQALLDKPVQ